MIVKKLGMVSGGGFPGAGYNERKEPPPSSELPMIIKALFSFIIIRYHIGITSTF